MKYYNIIYYNIILFRILYTLLQGKLSVQMKCQVIQCTLTYTGFHITNSPYCKALMNTKNLCTCLKQAISAVKADFVL